MSITSLKTDYNSIANTVMQNRRGAFPLCKPLTAKSLEQATDQGQKLERSSIKDRVDLWLRRNSIGSEISKSIDLGIQEGIFASDKKIEIATTLILSQISDGLCNGLIQEVSSQKARYGNKELSQINIQRAISLQSLYWFKRIVHNLADLARRWKKADTMGARNYRGSLDWVKEVRGSSKAISQILEQPVQSQRKARLMRLRGVVNDHAQDLFPYLNYINISQVWKKRSVLNELIQKLKEAKQKALLPFKKQVLYKEKFCGCDSCNTLGKCAEKIKTLIQGEWKSGEIRLELITQCGAHIVSLHRTRGQDYLVDSNEGIIKITDWDKFWPIFEKDYIKSEEIECCTLKQCK